MRVLSNEIRINIEMRPGTIPGLFLLIGTIGNMLMLKIETIGY